MQIGFFMWPRREYILLRLFVNTNVSVESVLQQLRMRMIILQEDWGI